MVREIVECYGRGVEAHERTGMFRYVLHGWGGAEDCGMFREILECFGRFWSVTVKKRFFLSENYGGYAADALFLRKTEAPRHTSRFFLGENDDP